jgi:hypothetical protein
LLRPGDRNHRYRRVLGLLAPAATIAGAREQAAESATVRSARRTQGAAYRARKEDAYRLELSEAIVAFLDFAPAHAALARTIADDAAQRAGEVGSGRVGRTKKLTLDERAALAARALIRHRYTDYEERLDTEVWDDDFLYRAVKSDAHYEVDQYIAAHR